jgi:hypothetical protein
MPILVECELLAQEQNSREIFYHLNPVKTKKTADFIAPFCNTWEEWFSD